MKRDILAAVLTFVGFTTIGAGIATVQAQNSSYQRYPYSSSNYYAQQQYDYDYENDYEDFRSGDPRSACNQLKSLCDQQLRINEEATRLMSSAGINKKLQNPPVCKSYEYYCKNGCLCGSSSQRVCGSDGQTYNNACKARCAGVSVQYSGRCSSNNNTNTGNCNCSSNYNPVCGTDGRTYTNSCKANCANVDIRHSGACSSQNNNDDNSSCVCTLEYNPVCGANGRTYSNSCFARCANVSVRYQGMCSSNMQTNYYDY